MRVESFILNILSKIEKIWPDVICYSYRVSNPSKTHFWWEVSVSNFEVYMENKRFKNLSKAWRKAAEIRGFKIIFICGWIPTEDKLIKLANEDNLIINL